MTDQLNDRLAAIFETAEALGYLNPSYTPVMRDEIAKLVSDLQEAATLLNAELAVSRAEIDHLLALREATRLYLGCPLAPDDEDAPGTSPIQVLRNEIKTILALHGGQKIKCIKELRCNRRAADAYLALGGTLMDAAQGFGALFSLVEAKEMIDSAIHHGQIRLPGRWLRL